MGLELNYQIIIHTHPMSVFPYLVERDKVTSYFPRESSSDLVGGKTVTYTFDGDEELEIEVISVDEPHKIVLHWNGEDVPYQTTAELDLKVDDTDTILHIRETGWEDNEAGQASRLRHMEGWVGMCMQLKARIEHDIDLRG